MGAAVFNTRVRVLLPPITEELNTSRNIDGKSSKVPCGLQVPETEKEGWNEAEMKKSLKIY